MQNSIFVTVLILLTNSLLGQRNLEIGVGLEDDGVIGHLGYIIVPKTNDTRFTRIALNGNIANYTKGAEEVPIGLYTASIENYRSINSFFERFMKYDMKDGLNFYLGAGLLGGYEYVNNGNEFLDNGKAIKEDSNIIYGGHIGTEMVMYIFGGYKNTTELFVNGRLNFYGNSDVGTIQPSVRAGIRFKLKE